MKLYTQDQLWLETRRLVRLIEHIEALVPETEAESCHIEAIKDYALGEAKGLLRYTAGRIQPPLFTKP